MANLYLHGLDEMLSSDEHKYVRFADDFVVMCRTRREADRVLVAIQDWVDKHGLVYILIKPAWATAWSVDRGSNFWVIDLKRAVAGCARKAARLFGIRFGN